jgi:uncharacterized protein YndB with AHSA1/START domain/DNA-binding transcriptional ArsR family regulator
MDEVFKAIDDPGRRTLLDALFERDGQTLGELCDYLPQMTRFGVMNHLRVLEDAGLLTTVKRGRSKHHYLNPVPIRLIHDRWIGKYAEPRVAAVTRLKAHVEKGSPMDTPDHVYKAYIRAGAQEVWDAIVDPDQTVQYYYGTRVSSDWQPGSALVYHDGAGAVVADGNLIAVDPPHRLEFTFQARWDPALIDEGPVREVWAIREVNGMAELTIEIYDMPADGPTYRDFTAGLPYIVSGLKSLVETGAALPSPN